MLANSDDPLGNYYKSLELFFDSSGGFKNSKRGLKQLFHFGFSVDHIPEREEIRFLRLLQERFSDLIQDTFRYHIAGVFTTIPLPQVAFNTSGHP